MAAEVALLAEGVDRNQLAPALATIDKVALLAEGVDRNNGLLGCMNRCRRSPSSRRAWIEIDPGITLLYALAVALLAEGVDRNTGWPLLGL